MSTQTNFMNIEVDSNKCQCPFDSLFVLNNDVTIQVCQNRKKSNRHLLCEEHYTKWQKILTQILTHSLATNPTNCFLKMKQFLCRKLFFINNNQIDNWNSVQNFVYAAYFYSVTQIFIMLVLCNWSEQSDLDELRNIWPFGSNLIEYQGDCLFEEHHRTTVNVEQFLSNSDAMISIFGNSLTFEALYKLVPNDPNENIEYFEYIKTGLQVEFINSMFQHIFSDPDRKNINNLTWTQALRKAQIEQPEILDDMFQYKSKNFYNVFFEFLNQTNEIFSDVLTKHNDGMSNSDEHDEFVTQFTKFLESNNLSEIIHNYLHWTYHSMTISKHVNIQDLTIPTNTFKTNLLVTQFDNTTCIEMESSKLCKLLFVSKNNFVKLYRDQLSNQSQKTIFLLELSNEIKVYIDLEAIRCMFNFTTLILTKSDNTIYEGKSIYTMLPVSHTIVSNPDIIVEHGLHVIHKYPAQNNKEDMFQNNNLKFVTELLKRLSMTKQIIHTIETNFQSKLTTFSAAKYQHTHIIQDICYAYNVADLSSYWNSNQMHSHQFASPYSLLANAESIKKFHKDNHPLTTNHLTLMVIGNPNSRFQICTITVLSNMDKSGIWNLDLWINFRPMHLIGFQPNDKQQKPDYESNGVGSINYLAKQIMKSDHNKDGLHTGYLNILTNHEHELIAYQQQNTSEMKLLELPKKTMQKHIEDFVFEILQVQKAKQNDFKSRLFKKNVLLMQKDDNFEVKNIIFNGISLGSGCATVSSVLFCKSLHRKHLEIDHPSIGLFQLFGSKDSTPEIHKFIKKKLQFSVQTSIQNDPFYYVPCEQSLIHTSCDEVLFDVGNPEQNMSKLCNNFLMTPEFTKSHINAIEKALYQMDNYIWNSQTGIFLNLTKEPRTYKVQSKRMILGRSAKRKRDE